MKKCRSESGLLFQLFMDRKQHIKQQSYDELLLLVARNQAKGASIQNEQSEAAGQIMTLDDGSEVPSDERLQDMVTYDIVPEIESYLHSIRK